MPKLERTALLEVPAEVAYKVVADVERYSEFLPHCKKVEIKKKSNNEEKVVAKVTVSGMGIVQSFITENTFTANQILMSLREGPFHNLEGSWIFTPISDLGCRIDICLNFEPQGLLAKMLSGFADTVADKLVDAFCRRVEDISTGQVVI